MTHPSENPKAGDMPIPASEWKLVPVEPNDDMQAAGAHAVRFDTTVLNKIWMANAAFRAMLEAAPPAPPPQQEPVAWGQNRFITDRDGDPIGTDDPQLVWGEEPPEESGWWPLYAAPVAQPDDHRLPYDVTVGGTTFRKGVSLSTFILAANRWHQEAFADVYMMTGEQKAANLARLQGLAQPRDSDSVYVTSAQSGTVQTALLDDAQTDAYAEGRRDEQQELSSVLPGTTYMDPPDGGAPTILEQLQRQAKDAARYLWLRNKGLKYANVGLGSDCDGGNVVDFSPTFTIPEPVGMSYEDNEWSLSDLDAALDAAMAPASPKPATPEATKEPK